MTKSAIAIRPQLIKSLIFAMSTSLVLAFVAIELGGITFYDTTSYRAVFSNSSDLQSGDAVVIAGVRVGKVTDLRVHDNTQSEVEFKVKTEIPLDDELSAAVRYRNLTGGRYLELIPGNGSSPFPDDGVIPASRTRPALDLDLLLGGLQPLFDGLDPLQINKLSGELVSVLQGQGGTLEGLLTHIASFTNTLADKDEVIGDVITNLNTVLGNLDEHSVELGDTISTMQQVVSGLSLDRGRLGRSFSDVELLVSKVSTLVRTLRDPFMGMIHELGRASRQANAGADTLNEVLRTLPGGYLRIGRLGSRQAGYNLYLCGARLKLPGPNGTFTYTPYIGPAADIERCKPGVAPLETPEEREAKEAAAAGEGR
ncbi:MAG TPA: MlaD family protein [Nocardioidaceae bacterium]|nr:MlaD family protein [Nocardioidaceae bacterium]